MDNSQIIVGRKGIDDLPKSTIPLDVLESSLEAGRVVPFFHSVWNNQKEKVEGVEALMRVFDKDNKILKPYDVLEVATSTGIYKEMQRMIIRKVFDTLKDSDLRFSINLFPGDIEEGDLAEEIIKLTSQFGVQGRAIVEILEWERVEDEVVFRSNLEELRVAGVDLALDDFGSAYSNIDRLNKYKDILRIVKLDGKAYVRYLDIEEDMQEKLCDAFMDIRNLGIQRIVAEHVESREIYEIIKQIGIDFSQGYYFDVPRSGILNLEKRKLAAE